MLFTPLLLYLLASIRFRISPITRPPCSALATCAALHGVDTAPFRREHVAYQMSLYDALLDDVASPLLHTRETTPDSGYQFYMEPCSEGDGKVDSEDELQPI